MDQYFNINFFNILHTILFLSSIVLLLNLVGEKKKKIYFSIVISVLFFVAFYHNQVTTNPNNHFQSLKELIVNTNLIVSYFLFLCCLLIALIYLFLEELSKGTSIFNSTLLGIIFYWFVIVNILGGVLPSLLFFYKVDLLGLIYSEVFPFYLANNISIQDFIQVFMKPGETFDLSQIDPASELKGKTHSYRTLPNKQVVACIDYRKIYQEEIATSDAPQVLKELYYRVTKYLSDRKDMECRIISPSISKNYPLGYPDKFEK